MSHDIEVEQDNRREHARLSLRRDPEQPLVLACDGIPARLVKPHWLRDKVLGIGSLKDVSVGGCGLISAAPLAMDSVLQLEVGELSMPCKVVRKSPVQGALHFYGLRWQAMEQDQLLALYSAISRLKSKRDGR
ncbi:type IV pilus assembly PilZ [Ferrimonas balearica DSM 9799]|uniref:Type IV pilus assembly PilZ n=1 Tax=Ferrimonas balearica (strain DSM 9799 / CCM 4581 / KCTC 23876 / PAT) TaxID=550540 RepID=E1SLD3_FERBD|nr:PilZ domain-containing protein [Ferrimonas balearica]ADN76497.1 type IV pilus assembly PilZ [Ferrimonas balearica DSM 9799]MBW3139397.1 PilZ domain-containing protein [Ferrimonas balearica]MBW3163014.1 PilZ domain-containing protein [Ferrimonas balearica]MBY5980706.1 PilZ domain-containing protein [Ferrimonas balearica]MBY6106465.1 PilZ domain-containing protein [Ferrimonas balearica]